jgi:hypothetical protein
MGSEPTKHINMKYHFLKDHVQLGTIKLRYLPTGDMWADMLTKPLPGTALVKGAHFSRNLMRHP